MASLSLKNVCKVYPNGFEAVKDFNLEVEEGLREFPFSSFSFLETPVSTSTRFVALAYFR